jgi:hypothetical protein
MVITLVAVMPLIALAVYVGDRNARSEREALRTALMSSARSLAAAVDREIDKHIAVAMTLTHSELLRDGQWGAFRIQAKEALSFLPGAGLIVADPTGQQILNVSLPAGAALPVRPGTNLDLQRRAFATGQPQVSDIFVGRRSGRPLATVDAPAFRDGAPLYVISIRLDPGRFRALLREQHYPADWYAAVVDRNGLFIARLLDPDGKQTGEQASAAWREAISNSADGIVGNRGSDGEMLFNAYARTAHGWTLGVAIRASALDAPVWHTRMILAVAALGASA